MLANILYLIIKEAYKIEIIPNIYKKNYRKLWLWKMQKNKIGCKI